MASELLPRAIAAHLREPGTQQPAADLSGPATAGDHNYIVLRNAGGVLPHSGALKRLKRWPKEVE